ncbi:MAG: hypothetical protein QOC59_1200 [Microbacteriaceae bacterium]|nr:hypothetical protein [Microbacteriaceae bacterium]
MTGEGTAGERAERLADRALFPDAADVDAADRVPERHLRLLDEAGLTGLAATGPDLATRIRVTSALAGGSLATAFVWLQHQGALAAVARSDVPGVAERFAAPLTAGTLRAGVAITGLRPPTPLTLVPDGRGLALTGRVPWVTGWGIADVLLVAALDREGAVRTALIDFVPAPTLRVEPLDLVAARAGRTVTLVLDRHPVPADRMIATLPLAEWEAADAAGLAGNGALSLGVAGRSARLAASDALLADVAGARLRLAAASPAELPAVRAACSALALRAAAALTVRAGSRSVLADAAAARLMREAQFLLAFGSRPAIREALLARFGA